MLGSTIQRELMEVIMRDLNDPRLMGLPSITRVKVSGDLSIADVFVTVMGTEGQQSAAINALKHSAGMLRAKLTRSLSLRQSPFLKFHLDENLRRELDTLEAIRKANEEDRARRGEVPAPDDEPAASDNPLPEDAEAISVDADADAASDDAPSADDRPLTTDH